MPSKRASARRRAGLVDAVGFGPEGVAGNRVGPGPASAANLAIFTPTAFAAETVRLAKGLKERVLLIGLDHRIFGKPAALDRQKSGGENLTNMADEHHAPAIPNAQWRPMPPEGLCRIGLLGGLVSQRFFA